MGTCKLGYGEHIERASWDPANKGNVRAGIRRERASCDTTGTCMLGYGENIERASWDPADKATCELGYD